ncbi:MAG TPA: lysophospholipid acyltransferase family protein [Geminicoccus sp.]|uniref:lysophospholipid acyltransferase family protein n=1 Tax=Geminicoccus sp. TaxID=2024832 RepID=UPI002D16B032|nr:lysophospholipid acyltransferase family protein [Geminicoccus sp.]HWL71847.1 lysophospholipid acyltransferase family protein [Geminicoccus sp.]
MNMLRWIGRDPVWQERIARLIAAWMGLLHRTVRMEFDAHPETRRIMTGDEGVVAGFWHGRLLFMPLLWRGVVQEAGMDPATPCYTLSSPHRDGAIMARTLRLLGLKPIIGSSGHGGTEAFREIRRVLTAGGRIGLSVDGGKGPRQRIQSGILLLAKHSGCPLVPVTGSCRWGIQAGSWDRMLIPAPWTKGILMLGAPIQVPKNADRDELARLQQQYEDAMNLLMDEADRRCGRIPTPPSARRPPQRTGIGERPAPHRPAE